MIKIPTCRVKDMPRCHVVHHYRMKPQAVAITHRPQIIKKQIVERRPLNAAPALSVIKAQIFNKANAKQYNARQHYDVQYKPTRNTKVSFDLNITKIKSMFGIGKGKILAIFAPGPSILEAEISKIKGIDNIHTMTINKPDLRCWETTYWMFCDRTQYDRNKETYHKYGGTVITTDSIKAPHPRQIRLRSIQGDGGFSRDLTTGVFIGRSTTYASMQAALYLDYDKIFIFGLDMCRVGGKLHSYGQNPDVAESVRESRFAKEAESYNYAAKILDEKDRSRFYMCSSYNPWPFANKFNRTGQAEAIDVMLNMAKEIEHV
jgi:hypothetical protein